MEFNNWLNFVNYCAALLVQKYCEIKRIEISQLFINKEIFKPSILFSSNCDPDTIIQWLVNSLELTDADIIEHKNGLRKDSNDTFVKVSEMISKINSRGINWSASSTEWFTITPEDILNQWLFWLQSDYYLTYEDKDWLTSDPENRYLDVYRKVAKCKYNMIIKFPGLIRWPDMWHRISDN
jgi:hypothetical protein